MIIMRCRWKGYLLPRDVGFTRRFISCHVMSGLPEGYYHVMSGLLKGLLVAT